MLGQREACIHFGLEKGLCIIQLPAHIDVLFTLSGKHKGKSGFCLNHIFPDAARRCIAQRRDDALYCMSYECGPMCKFASPKLEGIRKVLEICCRVCL